MTRECVRSSSPRRTCWLAALATVVMLLALVASPVRADASAPSSAASTRAQTASEFDDEFIGAHDAVDPLSNADLDDAGSAAVPAPTSPLSVFHDDASAKPTTPPSAVDTTREAKRLDWVHVHYEARIAQERSAFDNEEEVEGKGAAETPAVGTVVDSSRKLGRSPLVFELGGGTVLAEVERALLGARIGERRLCSVTLYPPPADRTLSPLLPQVPSGTIVDLSLEIVRFDQDAKIITVQERFWNLLPMLAFFAFMGLRLTWRQGVGEAPAGQAKPAAAAASRARGSRKGK